MSITIDNRRYLLSLLAGKRVFQCKYISLFGSTASLLSPFFGREFQRDLSRFCVSELKFKCTWASEWHTYSHYIFYELELIKNSTPLQKVKNVKI